MYNNLKPKRNLVIEPSSNIAPKEADYKKGVMTRYFAKKVSEVNSKIIEITKEKMNASPLYRYVSFSWLITGNKTQVFLSNRKALEDASKVLPSIGKFVPTFQFYRKAKSNLKTKKDVMQRLGIQKKLKRLKKEEGKKEVHHSHQLNQLI